MIQPRDVAQPIDGPKRAGTRAWRARRIIDAGDAAILWDRLPSDGSRPGAQAPCLPYGNSASGSCAARIASSRSF